MDPFVRAKISLFSLLNRVVGWLSKRLAMPNQREAGENSAWPERSRRVTVACAIVFVLALGTRVLYWQDNYADLQFGGRATGLQKISHFYYDQAQKILDDGGILFPGGPVDPGDASILTHPPGYSILMAAVFKAFYGEDTQQGLAQTDSGLRVVQFIGDAAASVLVLLIAAELFPIVVAIIAAILVGFSPHFAYYSLLLAPDTLSVLPILLAVYLIIRAYKRPGIIKIISAGAFIGLSCWLRSNALLLAPFLALVMPFLFARGRRLRYSVALISSTVVIIAPIIVRNWIIFDRFIPLSVMAGLNLVEGIGDYDKEERFGMPRDYTHAALKDAEWHTRPDYENSLWRPNGIERDQYRFARGLAVVRSNPGWFFGVMLRRMEFMLRYNDFRRQDLTVTTTAPTLPAGPNFGHKLEVTNEMAPLWSSSAAELIASGATISQRTEVSLEDHNRVLRVAGDDDAYGDQFKSAAIDVQENTDYVLRLAVKLEQGPVNVRVGTADPRVTLATFPIPSRKARRNALGERPMKVMHVPFATGYNNQVTLALYHNGPAPSRKVVRVGQADVFELGPTPNLWTRHPRAVIRGVQKNLFKTDVMRVLIAVGLVLLALAGRRRALLILLGVPAYYLFAQSTLHTEYRYILAIHYFLFVIAAAAIYFVASAIRQGGLWGYGLTFRRRATVRSNPLPTPGSKSLNEYKTRG